MANKMLSKDDIKCSLFIKGFSRNIRQAFRAACALRNVTMKDQAEKIFKEWLQNPERK